MTVEELKDLLTLYPDTAEIKIWYMPGYEPSPGLTVLSIKENILNLNIVDEY